ncbi:MAG: hypothetical protein JW995_11695 [Melioribacteraceae bacterium]|nr:hypothetical protein [Melioribacteraceae bacterium]
MFRLLLLFSTLIFNVSFAQTNPDKLPSKWYMMETERYDIYFTKQDSSDISMFLAYFDNTHETITNYFNRQFLTKFDVYIHPNRASLDLEWSANWNIPGFKSQCWMVGSGVADQFDLLSPLAWNKEACEHNPNDITEIQRLITHEMMHVYHGQINLDHFFGNMQPMAWFIEGVAILVAGQLNEDRMQEVIKIINEDRYPRSLVKFWEGNARYALSGSVVKYILDKYGKDILLSLLEVQSNDELLAELDLTEQDLIKKWTQHFIE